MLYCPLASSPSFSCLYLRRFFRQLYLLQGVGSLLLYEEIILWRNGRDNWKRAMRPKDNRAYRVKGPLRVLGPLAGTLITFEPWWMGWSHFTPIKVGVILQLKHYQTHHLDYFDLESDHLEKGVVGRGNTNISWTYISFLMPLCGRAMSWCSTCILAQMACKHLLKKSYTSHVWTCS